MAIPANCHPDNRNHPDPDKRYDPVAASKYFGAGTYRVNEGETLRYRGVSYKAGDLVDMTDAGAGAHFRKVTKVTEAELDAAAKSAADDAAKAAATAKEIAEKADAKKAPAKS